MCVCAQVGSGVSGYEGVCVCVRGGGVVVSSGVEVQCASLLQRKNLV